MTVDVTAIVAGIQQRIKAAPKGGVVTFDFDANPPFVISNLIQKMLTDKGYVVLVTYGGGMSANPGAERMYIDLSRRRPRITRPAQAG